MTNTLIIGFFEIFRRIPTIEGEGAESVCQMAFRPPRR